MPISLLFSLMAIHLAASQPASVAVSNIEHAHGSILIAVFSKSADFLEPDKAIFRQRCAVNAKGTVTITIPNLPEGDYAVSCFHDLNGNNMLDKNIFGIPTEPYGFSNNARPKFRAPTWEEAKCRIKGEINVRLEGW